MKTKERQPLSVTHPDLARQWSERNYPFTPDDETALSDSRVWWRCSRGHEWIASVSGRTKGSGGCPVCDRLRRTGKQVGDRKRIRPEAEEQKLPGNTETSDDHKRTGTDMSVPELGRRTVKRTRLLKKTEVDTDRYSDALVIKGRRDVKHSSNVFEIGELPLWKKPALTVNEAVRFYPISLRKMRRIIAVDGSAPYLAYRGGHIRVLRNEFDRFLDGIHDVLEVADVTDVNAR